MAPAGEGRVDTEKLKPIDEDMSSSLARRARRDRRDDDRFPSATLPCRSNSFRPAMPTWRRRCASALGRSRCAVSVTRRRRLDAHARINIVTRERETSLWCAALTCVGAPRRRSGIARLLGAGQLAHRGAARRPAAGRRALLHPRLCFAAELVAILCASRTSTSRSRRIRGAPVRPSADDFVNLKRKAGRRRQPRSPVLLRHRCIPALSRSLRRGRHARAARAGDPAGSRRSAPGAALRARSHVCASASRGLDDDPDAQADCRERRDQQVERPAHGVNDFHFRLNWAGSRTQSATRLACGRARRRDRGGGVAS